jgi:hypothetical protein
VGVYAGPDVSENGLVLALDAGNTKSYPGSGTNWTNLSGNGNNGTLVSGVGYTSGNSGSLVFDGVDDYSILNTNIFTNTLPNFTISVWYRSTIGGILIGNHYHNSTWESVWFSTTLFIVNGASNNTTNRQQLTYTEPSSNVWHNLVAISNNSSSLMQIFLDGSSYASRSATVIPWNSTIPPTIGAQRNIATGGVLGPIAGNIPQVLVYNRALTVTEIQQNYNATKSRFGL